MNDINLFINSSLLFSLGIYVMFHLGLTIKNCNIAGYNGGIFSTAVSL